MLAHHDRSNALHTTVVFQLVKSKTGFDSTDSILAGMIRFTCEAQLLPTIAALAFLGEFIRDADATWIYIGSNMEGKAAALSVIHVLNSRARLSRNGLTSSVPLESLSNGATRKTVQTFTTQANQTRSRGEGIRVDVEMEVRTLCFFFTSLRATADLDSNFQSHQEPAENWSREPFAASKDTLDYHAKEQVHSRMA